MTVQIGLPPSGSLHALAALQRIATGAVKVWRCCHGEERELEMTELWTLPPVLNNLMRWCFQLFSVHLPWIWFVYVVWNRRFAVIILGPNPYKSAVIHFGEAEERLRMCAPTHWDWKRSGLWGRLYSLGVGGRGWKAAVIISLRQAKGSVRNAGKHCEDDTNAIPKVWEHSDSYSHFKPHSRILKSVIREFICHWTVMRCLHQWYKRDVEQIQ